MLGHVPEDVIQQILQNLPVKSLLRFLSVCSSWRSIIKSPSFISNHLSKTNCQKQKLLLVGCWVDNDCWGYSEWQYSLRVDDDDKEFKEYRKLINLPFKTVSRWGFSEIVSRCNGLVCLKKKDKDSYSLWNPTFGKLFTVPKSNFVEKFDAIVDATKYGCEYGAFTRTLEGLGFDSSTNDYKLLRIVHVFVNDTYGDDSFLVDGWIDIYSYNTGSWKDITPPDDFRVPLDYFKRPQFFFVNGFLYSLGFEDTNFTMMVWQFDMAIEVFQKILLPEEMADVLPLRSLRAYGDSSMALFELSSLQYRNTGFHVWLMQENGGAEPRSWTKVFITEKEAKKLEGKLLFIRNNGELLLEKYSRGVVSYNQHRRRCHFLCKEGYKASVHYYVESLALLNIENEVTDAEFESAFVDVDSGTKNEAEDGDSLTDTDAFPFFTLDRKWCQFLDM